MNMGVLWMKKKFKVKNLIILVLSVIFLIGFIRQEKAMSRIENEKEEKQTILKELKEDNSRLVEQNNMINTGEYIEKLAREKLNMLKLGEWSTVNKKSDSGSDK